MTMSVCVREEERERERVRECQTTHSRHSYTIYKYI
jgi:hypothetical protein